MQPNAQTVSTGTATQEDKKGDTENVWLAKEKLPLPPGWQISTSESSGTIAQLAPENSRVWVTYVRASTTPAAQTEPTAVAVSAAASTALPTNPTEPTAVAVSAAASTALPTNPTEPTVAVSATSATSTVQHALQKIIFVRTPETDKEDGNRPITLFLSFSNYEIYTQFIDDDVTDMLELLIAPFSQKADAQETRLTIIDPSVVGIPGFQISNMRQWMIQDLFELLSEKLRVLSPEETLYFSEIGGYKPPSSEEENNEILIQDALKKEQYDKAIEIAKKTHAAVIAENKQKGHRQLDDTNTAFKLGESFLSNPSISPSYTYQAFGLLTSASPLLDKAHEKMHSLAITMCADAKTETERRPWRERAIFLSFDAMNEDNDFLEYTALLQLLKTHCGYDLRSKHPLFDFDIEQISPMFSQSIMIEPFLKPIMGLLEEIYQRNRQQQNLATLENISRSQTQISDIQITQNTPTIFTAVAASSASKTPDKETKEENEGSKQALQLPTNWSGTNVSPANCADLKKKIESDVFIAFRKTNIPSLQETPPANPPLKKVVFLRNPETYWDETQGDFIPTGDKPIALFLFFDTDPNLNQLFQVEEVRQMGIDRFCKVYTYNLPFAVWDGTEKVSGYYVDNMSETSLNVFFEILTKNNILSSAETTYFKNFYKQIRGVSAESGIDLVPIQEALHSKQYNAVVKLVKELHDAALRKSEQKHSIVSRNLGKKPIHFNGSDVAFEFGKALRACASTQAFQIFSLITMGSPYYLSALQHMSAIALELNRTETMESRRRFWQGKAIEIFFHLLGFSDYFSLSPEYYDKTLSLLEELVDLYVGYQPHSPDGLFSKPLVSLAGIDISTKIVVLLSATILRAANTLYALNQKELKPLGTQPAVLISYTAGLEKGAGSLDSDDEHPETTSALAIVASSSTSNDQKSPKLKAMSK